MNTAQINAARKLVAVTLLAASAYLLAHAALQSAQVNAAVLMGLYESDVGSRPEFASTR
jgi:hypothetical protein